MRSGHAGEALHARIREIESKCQRVRGALPFGLPHVDERLPDGGLASGALHEIAGRGDGAADGAAAALFRASIAARARGKVLWWMSRLDLFAPALAQAGLAPERVIYVEAGGEQTLLSWFEKGLRHGGLGGRSLRDIHKA